MLKVALGHDQTLPIKAVASIQPSLAFTLYTSGLNSIIPSLGVATVESNMDKGKCGVVDECVHSSVFIGGHFYQMVHRTVLLDPHVHTHVIYNNIPTFSP